MNYFCKCNHPLNQYSIHPHHHPHSTTPAPECEPGWQAKNMYCYKFFDELQNWQDAELRCIEKKVCFQKNESLPMLKKQAPRQCACLKPRLNIIQYPTINVYI